jgi:thymidylate synthase
MNNFKKIYLDLKTQGKKVVARGQETIELENYSYCLAPRERFPNFPSRKLKIDYIKNEFLWYLKGQRYDLSICNHASLWKGIIEADGGINSNYGQYIFAGGQFNRALTALLDDKESRRGSIVILSQDHVNTAEKDLPCTYSLGFRIREDKLNMSVHMRSQDSVFGMGNDAPAFSFIHEMMFQCLKEKYPELQMGEYFHIADSFHVYKRHYDMLENILQEDILAVNCPEISSAAEVEFLLRCDFSNIPAEFQFTRWLNEK